MNARNTATISRPGCWAMAGMLMLGVGALPHTIARCLSFPTASMIR